MERNLLMLGRNDVCYWGLGKNSAVSEHTIRVSLSKHAFPTPEYLALRNKMLFIILLQGDHNTTITPGSFLFLRTPTHTSKSSSDWTITKSGAFRTVSEESFPTPYSILTHRREIYPFCIWSEIIKINSWPGKHVCNKMKRGIIWVLYRGVDPC